MPCAGLQSISCHVPVGRPAGYQASGRLTAQCLQASDAPAYVIVQQQSQAGATNVAAAAGMTQHWQQREKLGTYRTGAVALNAYEIQLRHDEIASDMIACAFVLAVAAAVVGPNRFGGVCGAGASSTGLQMAGCAYICHPVLQVAKLQLAVRASLARPAQRGIAGGGCI